MMKHVKWLFLASLGFIVSGGSGINPVMGQDMTGPMQDDIRKLQDRVATLEGKHKQEEMNGCSLDPKKFLKVKCPHASLQIGGRIMLDADWFSHQGIGGKSGYEFRRVRLFAKGDFAKTWGWKAQFDFADNGVDTKDLYIDYQGLKSSFHNLVIRTGNFKVPFMLENLTSSKYISFIERNQGADFVSSLGADRKVGLGLMMGGDHFSASGGLFFSGVNSDDQGTAFENGTSMAGRVTVAPIAEATRVAHMGVGVLYRNNFKGDALRLRARPEIHLAGRAIDTGTMDDIKNALSYDFELAGVYGPFSLQGEYLRSNIDRSEGKRSFKLNSLYGEATWWITGESRNYSPEKGAFGRVKPKQNFSDGGPGAWMVGYRFSHANLNSGGIKGGRQDVHTLGLTWKANPYVALKLNGHIAQGKEARGKEKGAKQDKFTDRGITARVQVDF